MSSRPLTSHHPAPHERDDLPSIAATIVAETQAATAVETARLGAAGLSAASFHAAVAATAQFLQFVQAARAAGHFFAFVMTFVHALAHDARFRHAGPVGLHHCPFFAHLDMAAADAADDFLHLRDLVVDAHCAGPRLRSAFTAISGVLLLTTHPFINGPRRF